MFDRMIRERKHDWSALKADDALPHAIAGLCEEAGEVAGLLKRKYQYPDNAPDRETWCSELGDVLWYLINVIDIIGLNVEQVVAYNEQKLEARHGKR